MRIGEDIIERYRNPPAETVYPLEYAYYLLGDIEGKTIVDYGCGIRRKQRFASGSWRESQSVWIFHRNNRCWRKKELEQHNLSHTAEFRIGSAHELPFQPTKSVDVVFGMAILAPSRFGDIFKRSFQSH